MMGKTLFLAGTAMVMSLAFTAPAAAQGNWWNNTQISGRMYWDATSITHDEGGSSSTPSDDGTVGFDIKRFYVSIDHQFDKTWSADITTDFTYDSGAKATQLYIKKAYLRAHFSDAFDLRFGATDLPWVPFVEGVYGFRYIENTLIDRTKYGTSSDWGVHLSGNIPGGVLHYAVSVINGAGYKKPGTVGRSKGVDIEGRVDATFNGFVVAVGGYTGRRGKDVNNLSSSTHLHDATRFDALAAYTAMGAHVGIEYFSTNDWGVTSTGTANGYSAFAGYQINPQWGVLGRYDWVKTESSVKDQYWNIGVQYTPSKIVDFALVYKHDNAKDGTLSTSNGTIGGTPDGTYDEVGIWGRLRW